MEISFISAFLLTLRFVTHSLNIKIRRCVFMAQRLFHYTFQLSVSEISVKGFGFSQQVFAFVCADDFRRKRGQCIDKCYACCQRSCRKHSSQKSDDVATKAMLALIKRVSIYFSDFLKKRQVWPQVICLLSMLMPESEHTDFSKSCLCLFTGDACCQREQK